MGRGERGVVARLGALAAASPEGFSERVLERVGLARDRYAVVDHLSEPVYVAYDDAGVSFVRAVRHVGDAHAFERAFADHFGREVRRADALPPDVAAALRDGRARGVRLDLAGLSDFERSVLRKTLDIPRGEVRTYAWVAGEIGRPRAVRAVGSALGRNPVPILLPCHRVVRSDGSIGEYIAGAGMKRSLLAREGAPVDEVERLGRAGIRFLGSDTTHVFCVPSCRHARRVSPAHLVAFARADVPARRGYRPCRHCRPAPLATGG
ncbi:MAG TPA: methylated-DNA--[protein]-cysteine S-methyltransferase [Actinomycetota bacterium]|nr:methylated-DNA--[protein]-cysteine S-methyltransferase [Actinomycetota bacterium]